LTDLSRDTIVEKLEPAPIGDNKTKASPPFYLEMVKCENVQTYPSVTYATKLKLSIAVYPPNYIQQQRI